MYTVLHGDQVRQEHYRTLNDVDVVSLAVGDRVWKI